MGGRRGRTGAGRPRRGVLAPSGWNTRRARTQRQASSDRSSVHSRRRRGARGERARHAGQRHRRQRRRGPAVRGRHARLGGIHPTTHASTTLQAGPLRRAPGPRGMGRAHRRGEFILFTYGQLA